MLVCTQLTIAQRNQYPKALETLNLSGLSEEHTSDDIVQYAKTSQIPMGRVTKEYWYWNELDPRPPYVVSVNWERTDVPLTAIWFLRRVIRLRGTGRGMQVRRMVGSPR